MRNIDRFSGLARDRLGVPVYAASRSKFRVPKVTSDGQGTVDELVAASLAVKGTRMQRLLEDAELRVTGLEDQDTLRAAEGTDANLDALLRYLLGEE